MQQPFPAAGAAEIENAIFQAAITAGLTLFALFLYRSQRERWLAWWAAAWGLYLLRLLAIIAFLSSGKLVWLFAHQVATGWVALAILRAAMVFAGRTAWRRWYLLLAAFPLILALVVVNSLDRFLLVAIPMVTLISGATILTGFVFWRHSRRTGSGGARFVAVAFVLWGFHHLDYPFLRARGAWVPWGYFLDVAFELAVGVGFALMVLGDTARRLAARTGELSRLQARSTKAEEEVRSRLARDLHDDTAQTLSAVKLEIGLLKEDSGETSKERLERLLDLMDDSIRGVRRTVADLRPAQLDDLGLASAVKSLVSDLGQRSELKTRSRISADLPPLDPDVELALFRAAQEALSNVIRHSGAKSLEVVLERGDAEVILMVRDDGAGFPEGSTLESLEQEGHLGLIGMRERIQNIGGRLAISNSGGAQLLVSIPTEVSE